MTFTDLSQHCQNLRSLKIRSKASLHLVKQMLTKLPKLESLSFDTDDYFHRRFDASYYNIFECSYENLSLKRLHVGNYKYCPVMLKIVDQCKNLEEFSTLSHLDGYPVKELLEVRPSLKSLCFKGFTVCNPSYAAAVKEFGKNLVNFHCIYRPHDAFFMSKTLRNFKRTVDDLFPINEMEQNNNYSSLHWIMKKKVAE